MGRVPTVLYREDLDQVCCENPECNSEHPVECGPPAIATLTSVSTTNA